MAKRTGVAVMVLALGLGAGPAATQPTTEPTAGGPTTAPAVAAAPATRPADEVAAVLDKADAAYARLGSVALSGTVAGTFDVGGQKHDESDPFTSSFVGPNRFRHEAKDDALLVSTGKDVYAYLAGRDAYQQSDAPKARAASADWPAAVVGVLARQDPSLLLAIVPSAKAELATWDKSPKLAAPTVIDAVAYPTVRFALPADHQTVAMAFDPATGLLRRATFDLRPMLEKKGATDVKAATVTVDYTTAVVDAPADPAAFAWKPPVGAVLASATAKSADGDAGEGDDPKELVGSEAPAFTLKTPDGKTVRLSDLKGKPVVLDFWATWCGPCVGSLPHLDELYKDYAAKAPESVAIYAVNETTTEQDADAVKPFADKKGWSLPILLDADGSTAKAYRANAIPETVVVGKDGLVKDVFVGSGATRPRSKRRWRRKRSSGMSHLRKAHSVEIIERRLKTAEAAGADAMELVSLHDELARVERKWHEQAAAGSDRRRPTDAAKLDAYFDRLARQVEAVLRRADVDPAERTLLDRARSAIAARAAV